MAKQIIIEPTAQQGNAAVGQAEKPDQPTKISSEPSKEQSAAKQDNEKNKEAK